MCKLGYSETIREPGNRKDCDRMASGIEATLSCMSGLTVTLIYVAAAGQLVVIP